jgi:hypothetical protein
MPTQRSPDAGTLRRPRGGATQDDFTLAGAKPPTAAASYSPTASRDLRKPPFAS